MSDPIEIHVTEVDWFYECGYRYSRQKISGDWPETNSRPFMRGRAVHKAREAALHYFDAAETVANVREWPTFEELAQMGRELIVQDLGGEDAPWDPELEEHFWTEPDSGTKVPLSELEREIEPYIRFDLEHVLPRFESLDIVAIEERWHIPIEDPDLSLPYVLTGKIDMLVRETASGRLANHDLKTGAKISQEFADLAPQLSGYSAGIHQLYGEWPLHALGSPRFLKSEPRGELRPGSVVEEIEVQGEKLWGVYETVTTDRGPEDVSAFLERLKMFLFMREEMTYPPAKGGFMSPCARCPHAFAAEERLRCPYASTAGGKIVRR
jgi:hypothetical protein